MKVAYPNRCAREREGERMRERGREREKERAVQCVFGVSVVERIRGCREHAPCQREREVGGESVRGVSVFEC